MKLLRVLFNGSLAAIAVDGVVRVLVGLLSAVIGTFPTGWILGPVDFFAIGGAFAAWAVVGLAGQVPKRVVIPPVVAMIWVLCGALPVSALWFNQPGMQIGTGVVLLLSVVAAEGLARSAAHGAWLLKPFADGELAETGWRRSLGWVGGWLVLTPVGVALYAVIGAAWVLSWGTAGFLSLGPQGLMATHKVYTLDQDTVDLIAMVHLGEQAGYKKLFAAIPREGSLVLAEGVSDSQGLMTAPQGAYETAASAIGLSAQRPIDEIADLEVQNADVDVSSFSPDTLELLNAALGMYAVAENPDALTDYLDFWSRHRTDANQVTDQLFDDILHERNVHLLAEIERNRADRDRLVVPWGALHMVGVERALREAGWTQVETHKVVLIRWSTIRSGLGR